MKERPSRSLCRVQGSLDGGLSWLIVLASFLQQFIVLGTHNVFGLFYIDLLNEFKKDKAATAWVASLSFGITFLLGPLSTSCSARYGVRVVSLTGALLFGIGLLLTSFVSDLNQMYLTYSVIVGAGGCFSYYSSILILDEYFYKRLVTSNGLALSGAGVGTLALAPIVGTLLETFDWRSTLRILSAISVIQIICSFVQFFIKSPKRLLDCDFEEKTEKKSRFVDLSLFKNKAYVVWILVVSLVLFGFYIPYVHLVRHCQDLNISVKNGAILVGYLAIAQTIGKIVFGRIADHPRVNRIYLYQMCLLVCSVTTTLLPIMTSIQSIIVYCWVFGFNDGCFVLLIAVLTGDIVGKKNMSSAFGMMYSFSCIPMMLGPPVAGWMYAIVGSYVPAFFMAGAFTTIGVCLLFLVPILLPTEIREQWQIRRMRQEIKLSSDTSETTNTKTWSLSSGETSNKHSNATQAFLETKVQEKDSIPHVLLINNDKRHNSISLVLEKYFSMQHLITQRESLLCRVYSKENLYDIYNPSMTQCTVRETDV